MLGAVQSARSLLWRRSATAAGIYGATALGFFVTVVATRVLGTAGYALFAVVVASTGFFQLLLDLTVEEALVKFGFRYVQADDWGRLRRLFRLALAFKLAGGALAAVALAALVPFAADVWGAEGLTVPLLLAALVPLVQAPEGVAAGAIILRGRYDLRGAFLTVSMGLRLAGVGVGAVWGVTGAVAGMLAAQVLATVVVSIGGLLALGRFPRHAAEPIGGDRDELRRFVVSSTLGSSLISARSTLGTMLVGAITPIVQAAYFRNAQAPATGLAALSSPARLVLLTEQTRDYEAGDRARVLRLLRRYVALTTALMAVVVPAGWFAMPFLMGVVYGPDFRVHAANAARLVLVAAAIQLIWGWSKSFPVSIGRPNLRLVAQGIEIAVFVPLVVVFTDAWGATGAAGAMVVSSAVFALVWVVLLVRLRGQLSPPPRAEPVTS
jgi:O-antigen/teichoic acid export membrane protein